MKILKPLILILPIFLAGCSAMNSSFDCNVGSGGKCAPMPAVNEMANRGIFHGSRGRIGNFMDYKLSAGNYGANEKDSLLRLGESVQQVWIAPYEDASGIYHDAASIYMVAQKGRWTGKPPLAIIEDDEA
jgi:hypothetical protein